MTKGMSARISSSRDRTLPFRVRAALLLLLLLGTNVPAQPRNPVLSSLPTGQWVRIHEQKPGDAVVFIRQAHGGSTFDRKRGRLVLFGSDTHGEDWTNSPLFFDLNTLTWSRLYPDDDPATYRVNAEGIPVAGPNGDHPWAMHTFGALVYRDAHDDIIVASYPQHLVPGRFTNAMAHVWPHIRRHPTWRLDLATGRWQPLTIEAQHFFPYAVAYDRHRDLVYGYKAEGIFSLGGNPQVWRKALSPGLTGYGNNMVYDVRHRVFILFGSSGGNNDIVVYDPRGQMHRRMATPGTRPPSGESTPMAFHERLGKTLVIVDEGAGADRRARTWAYDYSRDAWQHIDPATLPFPVTMNYNMVYDPREDLLVLVTGPTGGPTAVWALRLP